jgi:hypothetical protein
MIGFGGAQLRGLPKFALPESGEKRLGLGGSEARTSPTESVVSGGETPLSWTIRCGIDSGSIL